MHHKRHRPKNRRAGCLLCKPNKANGVNDETDIGHRGFGKLRRLDGAKREMDCFLERKPEAE